MKKEIMQKPQFKVPSRKRRLLNVVIVIAILCVIYDVVAVGNIAYVAKWVSCGKQPIIVQGTYNLSANKPEGGIVNNVNFFTTKHVPIHPLASSNMYCTAVEAHHDQVFVGQ